MTAIESSAFNGCTVLHSIDIPNSVKRIGRSAFEGTKWLENQPDGIICINNTLYKFKGEPKEETISIQEGITFITPHAFNECTSLINIIISNNLTSIGASTFEDCTSLQYIDIPNSVTAIEWHAFKGCTTLQSVDIPSSVTKIGSSAFEGCTTLQSIDLPSSVTYIGQSLLKGCTSLQSIDIPNSVTAIERDAFKGCTALQSVDIPSSVIKIGSSAFEGCTTLQSIDIPSSVTYIEQSLLKGCTSLKSIDIPSSVTDIGHSAFYGCTSLQNVDIPNSVKIIRPFAFHGSGLVKIVIPLSVFLIGEHAFCNTPIIEYVVDKANRYFASFDGVLLGKDLRLNDEDEIELCRLLKKFPSQKAISSYSIDINTVRLDSCAFKGAKFLEEIVMHENINELGDEQTFCGCTSLKEMHIPPKIKCLPPACFAGCIALEQVFVPEREGFNVEKDSFKWCNSIKGLHFGITKPETILVDNSAFDDDAFFKCTLFIPSGTRWAYRHHPILGKFKNIEIEK